jgi:high-affinity K+ transport system ATPase subunit B
MKKRNKFASETGYTGIGRLYTWLVPGNDQESSDVCCELFLSLPIHNVERFICRRDFGFNGIGLWLWFTILFANFAEALAEGQGRAQAESLKKTRSEAFAKKLLTDGNIETISALSLRKDDLVFIEDGDPIPGDGEVIEGVALVDESAITGESRL